MDHPGYYEVPWRVKVVVVLLDLLLLASLFALFNAIGGSVEKFMTSRLNIPEESIWNDSERTIRITIEGTTSLLVLVGTVYTVIMVNRRILARWFRPMPNLGG